LDFLSIYWDVTPEALRITDSYAIHWYGILFALGYLFSYYVLMRIFKKEGLKLELLEKITMAAIIGGVVGARLGHCIFYEPGRYLAEPYKILFIWEGGLASHGGAIGVLLAFWYVSVKQKVSFITILSRALLVVPLAGAFIRLGNLMNSEIFGIPTDLPWGFIYPHSSEVLYGYQDAVACHPTQLYEALAYLLTFAVLQIYASRVFKAGKKLSNYFIIGVFMIGVFLARFLIEFIKNPQVDFENDMTLVMGQWLSIPFILFGLFAFYKAKKEGSEQ